MLTSLFADQAPQAVAYAELLRGPGIERGLLGPREGPRLWQRHILNCAAIAPIFGSAIRVGDIGSGAGLPGIVLALCRPDLSITLVEPLLRRATFLRESAAVLGLSNVSVRRCRAEEMAGEASFEAVTARAVAPLDTLVRWCLPLLRGGGELVALRGSMAAEEVRRTWPVLHRLGVEKVAVETYGAGFVEPPTTVVRIRSGR